MGDGYYETGESPAAPDVPFTRVQDIPTVGSVDAFAQAKRAQQQMRSRRN